MAKGWYPVVDKEKCIQCHQCVAFCPHGVYALDDAGYPQVINPDNCVEFCRGCSKVCDSGAISYFEGGRK